MDSFPSKICVIYQWSFNFSLEPEATTIGANSNLTVIKSPDTWLEDGQVQNEECKANVSTKCFNEPEVLEERPQKFAAEKIQHIDLNKEDDDFTYPSSEGKVAVSDRSLQNTDLSDHSTPNKSLQSLDYSNQMIIKTLSKQNGTNSGPCEPENCRNDVIKDGDSGALGHSNGFASTDCAVILEDGTICGEFNGVKCSNTTTVSNQFNFLPSTETADACSRDANETTVDVNLPSSKSTRPSVVCLYRCCSECLNALHGLTQKMLIDEWRSSKRKWTIEDVHDIVASLSMDLISVVKRVYVTGSFSNPVDENLRHEKLFECPELKTCRCKELGNGIVAPLECSCHSISHSLTTKANTMPSAELRFDLNFFFRDGVLVHMDPDKDVSFHCKFETLCLCSLIELIVMTKQPFD